MTPEGYDRVTEYWSLKRDVFFPFTDAKVKEYPAEESTILEKRAKYENLVSSLNSLTPNDIYQCEKNLLLAIDEILRIISASTLGHPLDRNQGLVIENYVYSKLWDVIYSAVKTPTGYGVQEFYYRQNGTFNATPVIDFFNRFKSEVENIKFKTYQIFIDLVDRYKDEMRAIALADTNRDKN